MVSLAVNDEGFAIEQDLLPQGRSLAVHARRANRASTGG
jgi:hypothetical protein